MARTGAFCEILLVTYQPMPLTEAGGQKHVQSADEETRELLRHILLELRKLSVHMKIVTGEQVTDGDIKTGDL